MDDDGEGGTPGASVAESIAVLGHGEVLAGGSAETLTRRMSAAARADGPSFGTRGIEALGAGAGDRAVGHAAALGADAGDAAGERARAGDHAP